MGQNICYNSGGRTDKRREGVRTVGVALPLYVGVYAPGHRHIYTVRAKVFNNSTAFSKLVSECFPWHL